MKASDRIFRFTGWHYRDGLCRVRTFVNWEKQIVIALITDLGNLNPSGSVVYLIEVLVKELIAKLVIPKESIILQHLEPYGSCTDHRFSLVTFDKKKALVRNDMKHDEVLELLSTNEGELKNITRKNEILMTEIETMRVQIDPLMEFSYVDSAKLVRQLTIEDNMVRKSELQELINTGASERQIQSLIKKDLSLLAEAYASPSYNYICFSEFPVDKGFVDFAIFTGVSWMTVILIEVKGADFNIVNQSGYQKFNANIDTAASQIRERIGFIHRYPLVFKEHVHQIRERVISGQNLFNAFPGPEPTTQVDPNKDVNFHCIIIGGRTVDDLKESSMRHDFERYSSLPINLESWDSYLRKLRRS
ncbi:Shedu immune nuclease family protein [Chitinophaga nivalis]|uniref:DUF4263 domain-containing protein n=1 Tax=Chitinophaga nivalis TaxID=2991709 RepID=A0ABT3IQU6_9BACT|nr:Shedu immune nuclease family protein [Chitinophaga nivalis]MCW3463965.1 DUF4263 domain-containing protein [Chitinophaga nivalis]MCW3486345.1 DUF4263 domain-containing protein [Chitinophaga nivalis]